MSLALDGDGRSREAGVGVTDDLLSSNRRFAESFARRHLDVRPTLEPCDRDVHGLPARRLLGPRARGRAGARARNAGGVITDDVIRSLAISQRRLGTREIALIHHTDCGMQLVTDDGFRAELQETTGMAPSFAIESFTDVEADVRQSIARVRHSPFLPHRDQVRGFVYDVDTGLLTEVGSDVPGSP